MIIGLLMTALGLFLASASLRALRLGTCPRCSALGALGDEHRSVVHNLGHDDVIMITRSCHSCGAIVQEEQAVRRRRQRRGRGWVLLPLSR